MKLWLKKTFLNIKKRYGKFESFKNPAGEFYIPLIGDIGTGFFSGVWAYNGWNKLNYIIEEIKSPEKNLAFAVIGSLGLVTMFYPEFEETIFFHSYFLFFSFIEILESFQF